MKAETLIDDLIEMTRNNLNRVQHFTKLSAETLNYKTSPESWSILECIEHLNRYSDFYIPEIGKRIEISKYPAESVFKPGWLGDYWAKGMLPKEKLNKMKTFKSMNPVGSSLNREVLKVFTEQQREFLKLLDAARKVSLSRTKTAISISKWIKLKLGDTFRVVIYHNLRHLVQAEKAMTNAPEKIVA